MNTALAEKKFTVEAQALTWMAVHGNLCLALRHPDNRGASRERMITIIKDLGKLLVDSGFMTQAEMADAMHYERLQGNIIL